MAIRLNDAVVHGLEPQSTRKEYFDGNGLGIRITPRGTKTWVYLYRWRGKPRRLTLGRFPQMSYAEALKGRAEAAIRLERGFDPGKEESDRRGCPRVRELVELYIDRHARPKKRSWKEDQRLLKKYVVPKIGRLRANEVRRRDIVSLLDDVVDGGAPVSANRVLAVTRKMFNFAISRDILETSPCFQVARPTKEHARQRRLTPAQIRVLLARLPECPMSGALKIAVRLLLFTGQRSGELLRAPWGEFDLESGWWTIAADRAKNGKTHRVPLSQPVRQLLRQAKMLSGRSPWLFPSPVANAPIDPSALGKALSRSQDLIGLEKFTAHDLRRTAASGMASLGLDRLVISKLLNHSDRSVTGIYDQHLYEAEKREAVERWAEEIYRIECDTREDPDLNLLDTAD